MKNFTKNNNNTASLLLAITASFLAANTSMAQDKTVVTIQGEKIKTVSNPATTGTAFDIASTKYVEDKIANGLSSTAVTNKLDHSLTESNIFVGNAAGIATGVPVSGEAIITSTGAITLNNAAVLGKTLTGFTSNAGTITAADNLLTAIQKLNGNVAAAVAGGVSSVTANPATTTGSTVPTLSINNTNPNIPVISIDIPLATTAGVTAGLISKTEYDTFNGKLNATLTSSNIFVGNGSGTAVGVPMGGQATIDNAGIVTLNNAAVVAKTLGGFSTSTATGSVSDTDSILDAIKKLSLNVTALSTSQVSEKFTASANATTFTLSDPATGVFSVYINGQRVPTETITTLGKNATYDPTQNNGTYNLQAGDVVTIQYFK